jgi:membrane-bound ClpP family serine protease
MPAGPGRSIVLAALLLAAVALLARPLLAWAVLGVLLWMGSAALRRRRRGAVGEVGTARTALAPRGEVLVRGGVRVAEASEPVAPGEQVCVLGEEQGVLRVAPLPARGAAVWSPHGWRWRR